MTPRPVNETAPEKAVGSLAKIFGKDPRSGMLAFCVLIIFWLLWDSYKKDIRYEEMINTVHLLVFPIVKEVKDNSKEIEVIKTKEIVVDSLQKK